MLPKVETPTLETKLPSTGETVEYRPFLVKEEKILMLASQGEDFTEMVQACGQIVDNCTFNKLNVKQLPMFDLQDLFLQIRKSSIGETQDFNLICGECGGTTNYELELDELKVQGLDNLPNDKIEVGDEFIIKMKYPNAIEFVSDEGASDISTISSCIEYIETQEERTNIEDVSDEDLQEFVENLPIDVMNEMRKFIQGMPVLEHTINYKCPHCEAEQFISINGYEHFFA